MIGYHEKAILLVHSVGMELSLDHLPDLVHAVNFHKENISVLKLDIVLDLEAMLCHCPLNWHICSDNSKVAEGTVKMEHHI
jgi:hypothetical protein